MEHVRGGWLGLREVPNATEEFVNAILARLRASDSNWLQENLLGHPYGNRPFEETLPQFRFLNNTPGLSQANPSAPVNPASGMPPQAVPAQPQFPLFYTDPVTSRTYQVNEGNGGLLQFPTGQMIGHLVYADGLFSPRYFHGFDSGNVQNVSFTKK